MSNTLETIKNKLAVEKGYKSIHYLRLDYLCYGSKMETFMQEVAESYAEACSKASLEKASEKATTTIIFDDVVVVDKESITNPDNIVML